MPKLLWENLLEISTKLRLHPKLLLLSDFDGTLVPIQDHPEWCCLTVPLRRAIHDLQQLSFVQFGVISGRALKDIHQRVNLSGLIYSGNHGLEILGPDFHFVEPSANSLRPIISHIAELLERVLMPYPQVWVEDKCLSLSIHLRKAKIQQRNQIEKLVESLIQDLEALNQIELRSGKDVVEVRPKVGWNKSNAVTWLMNKLGNSDDFQLVYLGDDKTDEDVFQCFRNKITLGVGTTENTSAEYHLSDYHEVLRFMDWLHITQTARKEP